MTSGDRDDCADEVSALRGCSLRVRRFTRADRSVRVRRSGVVGTLALGAVMALVLGAASVVVDPAPPPAAAAPGCGPAPQGRVAVVVVIDHGGGTTPSSRCVVVEHGSTGLDALRAAGHQVRLDGGFVCAIDARPATGCGNVPGHPYWRYWHAAPGGSWDYSQVGAGGYRLPTRCAVEGWSWSDSTTSRPPPRIAAPTPTCEAAPPTSAPPVPSPTTAPVVAPVLPASPGAPPAQDDAPGGVSTGSDATGDGGGAGRIDADGTVSTAPDAPGDAADGGEPGGDDGSGGGDGDRSPDVDGATDRDEVDRVAGDGSDDVDGELAADQAAGRADGGSTPWGVLIAVVLVAALAGASVVRTRARRDAPTSPTSPTA